MNKINKLYAVLEGDKSYEEEIEQKKIREEPQGHVILNREIQRALRRCHLSKDLKEMRE